MLFETKFSMKAIFEKVAGTGVDEMKNYFAQIPGMVGFGQLRPDVMVAQDELTKFVGEAIVNRAIDHYHSDNYESENPAEPEASGDGSSGPTNKVLDELVHKVQDVVTLFAYRDYALNADATHSATGRVSRNDHDSDTLNLKLIDADDQALQRKGQRALERLIKFIDKEQFEEWTGSVVYSQTRELFLWNAELFDRYFPIEKNTRLYLLLVPMIRKAQVDHIVPRLTSDVYADLMDKVKADTIEDPADLFLYDLICYPIAEMAMSEAYLKLPLQLFPEKMAQLWGPGNGASALVLREKMVADIEKKGLQSLQKLENEIEKRAAAEAGTEITDETIVDIVDRMDAGNLYARV
jgi:hypothetical protein